MTANREIDDILQRGADGGRITPEEALLLYTEAPFHALGEAADAGAEAACLDGLAFGAALAAAAEAAAATAGRRVTLTTSLASLPGTYDIVAGAPGRPPLRARVALAAGGSTWAAPRPGDDRAAAALGGGAQGGAWARGWDKLAEMLGGLARAAGEA